MRTRAWAARVRCASMDRSTRERCSFLRERVARRRGRGDLLQLGEAAWGLRPRIRPSLAVAALRSLAGRVHLRWECRADVHLRMSTFADRGGHGVSTLRAVHLRGAGCPPGRWRGCPPWVSTFAGGGNAAPLGAERQPDAAVSNVQIPHHSVDVHMSTFLVSTFSNASGKHSDHRLQLDRDPKLEASEEALRAKSREIAAPPH